MVDVGAKPQTQRTACAGGEVVMQPETLQAIRDQRLSKGNVLEVARLAGIMATKKTADLIPLCHSLGLDSAEIEFAFPNESTLSISARVATIGRTGVEMEALTAVSVTALTVYDMCKAIDRAMTIERIRLLEKTGGRSGDFRREETG